MRTELNKIGIGKIEQFSAVIGRCGIKYDKFKDSIERTLLIKDVTHDAANNIVTDHLWLTVDKTLCELDLKAGDKIIFSACVWIYLKGVNKDIFDFTLDLIKIIQIISDNRELEENEITTKTLPAMTEYKKACERKEKEIQLKLLKEKEEKEKILNMYIQWRQDVKNGIYPYSVPLGYIKSDNKEKPMVIDPENAKNVKRAFLLCAATESIKPALDEIKLVYPTMNKKTFKKILSRYVYTGKIKYNGKTYIGKHEALISEEIFKEVQIILNKKKKDNREVLYSDGKINEGELTTAAPVTFEEWKNIQILKYLEKKYNKDYHGADYLEQIEDLKAKIKDKYYNINGSEV